VRTTRPASPAAARARRCGPSGAFARGEHRTARALIRALPAAVQRRQRGRDVRVAGGGQRLKVVAVVTHGKDVYFRRPGRACQFRCREHRRGRHRPAGSASASIAAAAKPARSPRRCRARSRSLRDEERHVRAELHADPRRVPRGTARAPEAVQPEQHARGVGAAATEPATRRDALIDCDRHAARRPVASRNACAARIARSACAARRARRAHGRSHRRHGARASRCRPGRRARTAIEQVVAVSRRPVTCRNRLTLAGAGTTSVSRECAVAWVARSCDRRYACRRRPRVHASRSSIPG